MRKWFEKLSARERWMVSGAGIVVLVFLFYFLVWSPMGSAVSKLNGRIQYNNSLITWMQRVSQEIQALPQNVSKKQNLSLASIQSALQSNAVSKQAVTFTQSNENSFDLTVKDAQFDKLIAAVIALQKQSKADIQKLSLKREDSGFVSGSITLVR